MNKELNNFFSNHVTEGLVAQHLDQAHTDAEMIRLLIDHLSNVVHIADAGIKKSNNEFEMTFAAGEANGVAMLVDHIDSIARRMAMLREERFVDESQADLRDLA